MPEKRVGVARAAQILGICRQELQTLIQRGELASFEGKVDLDALSERFPSLARDEAPIMENVRLLRTTAFSRRVRETVAPEKGELEQKLARRNSELSLQRGRADQYEAILDDLLQMLGRMQCEEAGERKLLLLELNRWLIRRMRDGSPS